MLQCSDEGGGFAPLLSDEGGGHALLPAVRHAIISVLLDESTMLELCAKCDVRSIQEEMAASGFHLFFSKMQNQVLIASSARFAPLPFQESEQWLLAVLDHLVEEAGLDPDDIMEVPTLHEADTSPTLLGVLEHTGVPPGLGTDPIATFSMYSHVEVANTEEAMPPRGADENREEAMPPRGADDDNAEADCVDEGEPLYPAAADENAPCQALALLPIGLAQLVGDGSQIVLERTNLYHNINSDGSLYTALWAEVFVHGGSGQKFANVDAHISLCRFLPRDRSKFENIISSMEAMVRNYNKKRNRNWHYKGTYVFNNLSGTHYAWCDLLVQSPLHGTAHAIQAAGLRQTARKNAGWCRPSFHLSFTKDRHAVLEQGLPDFGN